MAWEVVFGNMKAFATIVSPSLDVRKIVNKKYKSSIKLVKEIANSFFWQSVQLLRPLVHLSRFCFLCAVALPQVCPDLLN